MRTTAFTTLFAVGQCGFKEHVNQIKDYFFAPAEIIPQPSSHHGFLHMTGGSDSANSTIIQDQLSQFCASQQEVKRKEAESVHEVFDATRELKDAIVSQVSKLVTIDTKLGHLTDVFSHKEEPTPALVPVGGCLLPDCQPDAITTTEQAEDPKHQILNEFYDCDGEVNIAVLKVFDSVSNMYKTIFESIDATNNDIIELYDNVQPAIQEELGKKVLYPMDLAVTLMNEVSKHSEGIFKSIDQHIEQMAKEHDVTIITTMAPLYADGGSQ